MMTDNVSDIFSTSPSFSNQTIDLRVIATHVSPGLAWRGSPAPGSEQMAVAWVATRHMRHWVRIILIKYFPKTPPRQGNVSDYFAQNSRAGVRLTR